MSMIGAAYCIHCDHKVEYCVRSQRISVDIRGIVSTYDELVACCSNCGEEIYVAEINDANAVARKEAYEMAKRVALK